MSVVPEVSRFFGLLIKIQYQDHGPPHFHVWHGGRSAARVDIRKLKLLPGDRLGRPQLSLVLAWAYLHQRELMNAWDLASLNRPPGKIPPLR